MGNQRRSFLPSRPSMGRIEKVDVTIGFFNFAVGLRAPSLRPVTKIALISPKGPLYRHRGGIWKKSLRYQPLTLTTLAALVPDDVPAEIELIDEGIADVPLDLEADLVGLTVITGTARRAYELADHFRARGITVVLGGPHVTLIPEDAEPHADAVVVGYAEDTWPQLLRDFAAGEMQTRYHQAPGSRPRRPTLSAPRSAARASLPDQQCFRGNARLRACVRFLRGADSVGSKTVAKARRGSRRGYPPARRAETDLRRSEPHRASRLRDGAFHCADPVARAVVWTRDGPARR